jgi:hypothetical protein
VPGNDRTTETSLTKTTPGIKAVFAKRIQPFFLKSQHL